MNNIPKNKNLFFLFFFLVLNFSQNINTKPINPKFFCDEELFAFNSISIITGAILGSTLLNQNKYNNMQLAKQILKSSIISFVINIISLITLSELTTQDPQDHTNSINNSKIKNLINKFKNSNSAQLIFSGSLSFIISKYL